VRPQALRFETGGRTYAVKYGGDSYGDDARRGEFSRRATRILNFSIPLVRIWGVRVRLHWSFFLIALFFANWTARGGGTVASRLLWGLVHTVILYGLVLIHEFSHVTAAWIRGRPTRYIVLTPLGGAAVIDGAMGGPGMEAEVAFAGPASNLVLLAVSVALIGVFGYPRVWYGPGLFPALAFAFHANVAQALFNLLPAFPLDGGRILRALLSWRRGERAGTRLAARIGEAMGVALIGFGIWIMGTAGWVLAGIGVLNIIACETAIKYLDLGFGVYEQTAWPRVAPSVDKRRRALEKKAQEDAELERQLDLVLDKVSRKGLGSLNRREKSILKKASKKFRGTVH
jgi:Zn-dependent protease